MSSALPLVTLPGRSVDLGIDAARVLRVTLRREWPGAAPLDLAACLGWEESPADEDSPGRVLVVGSLHGEVPVSASGKIDLGAAERPSLLALSAEVLHGNSALALTGVIINEGRRPILLLDPEGLWRLNQRRGK